MIEVRARKGTYVSEISSFLLRREHAQSDPRLVRLLDSSISFRVSLAQNDQEQTREKRKRTILPLMKLLNSRANRVSNAVVAAREKGVLILWASRRAWSDSSLSSGATSSSLTLCGVR